MRKKKDLFKRLEALEQMYNQEPLSVLALTDHGEEITITMRECLEREDVRFIKVIRGANLQDLDLFLKDVREKAKESP